MTSRDGEERASSPHHHEQHLPSRDLGRSHLASISLLGEITSRQHLVIVGIAATYGERGRAAHSACTRSRSAKHSLLFALGGRSEMHASMAVVKPLCSLALVLSENRDSAVLFDFVGRDVDATRVSRLARSLAVIYVFSCS